MMKLCGIVFVLVAFCCGHLSARDIEKRQQIPPAPPADFKTELYRVYGLLVKEQIKVFTCYGRLFFKDPNPQLPADPVVQGTDAPTTPAPVTPAATPAGTPAATPAGTPAAAPAKRQYGGQGGQGPILPWEENFINEVLGHYDEIAREYDNCMWHLQNRSQQPQ